MVKSQEIRLHLSLPESVLLTNKIKNKKVTQRGILSLFYNCFSDSLIQFTAELLLVLPSAGSHHRHRSELSHPGEDKQDGDDDGDGETRTDAGDQRQEERDK